MQTFLAGLNGHSNGQCYRGSSSPMQSFLQRKDMMKLKIGDSQSEYQHSRDRAQTKHGDNGGLGGRRSSTRNAPHVADDSSVELGLASIFVVPVMLCTTDKRSY